MRDLVGHRPPRARPRCAPLRSGAAIHVEGAAGQREGVDRRRRSPPSRDTGTSRRAPGPRAPGRSRSSSGRRGVAEHRQLLLGLGRRLPPDLDVLLGGEQVERRRHRARRARRCESRPPDGCGTRTARESQAVRDELHHGHLREQEQGQLWRRARCTNASRNRPAVRYLQSECESFARACPARFAARSPRRLARRPARARCWRRSRCCWRRRALRRLGGGAPARGRLRGARQRVGPRGEGGGAVTSGSARPTCWRCTATRRATCATCISARWILDLTDGLLRATGVVGTTSYFDTAEKSLISRDGHEALVIVSLAGTQRREAAHACRASRRSCARVGAADRGGDRRPRRGLDPGPGDRARRHQRRPR